MADSTFRHVELRAREVTASVVDVNPGLPVAVIFSANSSAPSGVDHFDGSLRRSYVNKNREGAHKGAWNS